MRELISQLAKEIEKATHIVFLTGAGMSTSSGIPDFRSTVGFWTEGVSREQFISRSYFHYKPKDFWSKYKDIFQLKLMGNYFPNEGHLFLRELEEMGKKVTILTQNVDNLHTKAGSGQVIELHGTIHSATCPKCQTQYSLEYINKEDIPRCEKPNKKRVKCGFILKPDVVLFGDLVKGFKEAEQAISESTLFVVMGSSLKVKPVSDLPHYSRYKYKNKLAIINLEKTDQDDLFDIVIHSEIVNTLRKIKEAMKK